MADKWDKRYIEAAKLFASWSKDPRTKVGAVIIGNHGQIVSQGYNGFPQNIDDSHERLTDRETKRKYVIHAEANAIYNAISNGAQTRGCSIYVHGLPVCHECAKAIIQCGITRVIYDVRIDESNMSWYQSSLLSLSMFEEANIEVVFLGDNNGTKIQKS